MKQRILLLGGDARQRRLAALLERSGYDTVDAASPAVFDRQMQNSGAVILPCPVSRDGVFLFGTQLRCSAVIAAVQPGQMVCGGGFSAAQREALERRGARVFDVAAQEAFLLTNAHLTAQGALRLLLEDCTTLLSDERILITGYGRVGAALAARLVALHCDVYVAARREAQRSAAALSGCKTLLPAQLPQTLHLFDRIVNTVPHRLFSKTDVARCKPGIRYLELASAPFGADRNDFSAGWTDGAALPGRFTPDGSAALLFSLIEPLLKEGESASNRPSATP